MFPLCSDQVIWIWTWWPWLCRATPMRRTPCGERCAALSDSSWRSRTCASCLPSSPVNLARMMGSWYVKRKPRQSIELKWICKVALNLIYLNGWISRLFILQYESRVAVRDRVAFACMFLNDAQVRSVHPSVHPSPTDVLYVIYFHFFLSCLVT